MRIRAAFGAAAVLLALAAVTTAACGGNGGGFFRQYEYEEEVYLALDGTATVYVNASIPALDALRGTSFAATPNAPLDRAAVRAFFSTAVTRVIGQVSTSRRSNRRFVHVRMAVDDIRRLADAAPFAWSTYDFKRDGDLYVYRQTLGPAAGANLGHVGWTGRELVAFRLHLPSKIEYHNYNGPVGRGNILVWEQPLAARLRGTPLTLDARMDPQSILYRTLWLFGWTFVAVGITFAGVIWWVLRRAPAEQRAA
jgi:hypothetical protein